MQCKKCGMYKMSENQKCACTAKKFNEEKLSKKANPQPIKQISEKKKERLKKGSEVQKFKEIAIKRQVEGKVTCEVCNKKIDLETLTHWNFDHEIPKSRGEEYRLDENNIRIKCVACHFKKTNGQELKVKYSN